jgi:hypothetical protein
LANILLQTKPQILCHPNIPKPLHGVAPRAIMGEEWWDKTRKEVYKRYSFHCIACGVWKPDAKKHQWLEAHEFYNINYSTGVVQIMSIEPLCHYCHNFIHSGRLESLIDKGEITPDEGKEILAHGFAILKKHKLKCFPGTLTLAEKIGAETFGVKAYREEPCGVSWKQWRLLWQNEFYHSKFKNYEEWEQFYSQRKEPSMALERKTTTAPPIQTRAAGKVYSLPTAPTEPVDDLGAFSFLIYGQKKIGKTSLWADEDALYFMFEPGAKALRIKRVDIATWEDALGYLTALEKAAKKPKTVIIDTGFEAHQKCMTYVCKKEGIEYPREDNFGKDWTKIKNELRGFHNRLFALGVGVVVLCHETVKENQTYAGVKYDQITPLLAKAGDDFYRAVIDNVWWYHYRGKQRFIQIRGTDHAMSGTALQADRFFKTSSGEPVYAIPIPNDPHKGMEAIRAAFHNKQAQSFKDETEQFSDRSVKDSISKKVLADAKKARRGR